MLGAGPTPPSFIILPNSKAFYEIDKNGEYIYVLS